MKPGDKRGRLHIVSHPNFVALVTEYNDAFRSPDFKTARFHRDRVQQLIPGYDRTSFYNLVRNYSGLNGFVPVSDERGVIVNLQRNENLPTTKWHEERIPTNEGQAAAAITRRGIDAALKAGADALERIAEENNILPPEKKADLMFKAMRAQNARMNVTLAMRREARADVSFQRAFSDAAFLEAQSE